jgi:hypothetical protein
MGNWSSHAGLEVRARNICNGSIVLKKSIFAMTENSQDR